ncbi:MAG: hypothetical protein ACFFG0_47485 [Candidatus Thorarchaeota archaeon]
MFNSSMSCPCECSCHIEGGILGDCSSFANQDCCDHANEIWNHERGDWESGMIDDTPIPYLSESEERAFVGLGISVLERLEEDDSGNLCGNLSKRMRRELLARLKEEF